MLGEKAFNAAVAAVAAAAAATAVSTDPPMKTNVDSRWTCGCYCCCCCYCWCRANIRIRLLASSIAWRGTRCDRTETICKHTYGALRVCVCFIFIRFYFMQKTCICYSYVDSPKVKCSSVGAQVGDQSIHLSCEVNAKPPVSTVSWVVDSNGTSVSESHHFDGFSARVLVSVINISNFFLHHR